MEAQEKSSLYDRLGGVYNIATVVGDLIDRVMVDGRLSANPRVDEAHHRVSPAGFKYFVTEMVCWTAGGPQKYSGRPMGDSHHHLIINEEEWEAFMDDFQQTLNKFEVPQQEQEELKATVESTKEAVVVRPFHEGPAAKNDQQHRSGTNASAEHVFLFPSCCLYPLCSVDGDDRPKRDHPGNFEFLR